MVIIPPQGADKAFSSLQTSIQDILSNLGIKSILDMFASPEFQAAMPAMGMALGGGGMGGIGEAVGRGGGASSISSPSAAYKTFLQTGVNPPPQQGPTEALNKALPLMKDPMAIQRISDLLKMLGGQ